MTGIDIKIRRLEEPAIRAIHILRDTRRVDLMEQEDVPGPGPGGAAGRARQPGIRELTLRGARQADVLGGVGGELGAVDPEAEERVARALAVGGRDEDLGDVDVADQRLVVLCGLLGGVGGGAGEGRVGGGDGVGVGEGEGGRD